MHSRRRLLRRLPPLGGAAVLALLLAAPRAASPAAQRQGPRFPNVLVVTIDTLRADRLSGYGYHRATTPNLDAFMATGVRFTQARTVEPLTNPAICSLFTSLHPHEHGATRNGLAMRPGLPSAAAALRRRGYRSAAVVGNWTLKDRISGLAAHFDAYHELFTRKRWFGVFKGEATAADLTDAALDWLAGHQREHRRPFLLWVHYVEPHAPYRLQEGFAGQLGMAVGGEPPRADRYDSEIAFADHHVGRLLAAVERDPALAGNTIVLFTADHGESLGEHGVWGHGRQLFDTTLRIPLAIAWPGRIRAGVIDAQALNLDIAPTLLGLAGLPVPASFRGFDWSGVLQGAAPPRGRVTWFQAHKGAVLSAQEVKGGARRRGLLEVALLSGTRKEILRLDGARRWLFDLARDPAERRSQAGSATRVSLELERWMAQVQQGLVASDRQMPIELDPESVEKLRALGYAE
ncbi:MAG TPA: sulfatase [Thermoanaerobaculia bacterium]|nr:sulfatase [Thermoanaerobaculia bacterium]